MFKRKTRRSSIRSWHPSCILGFLGLVVSRDTLKFIQEGVVLLY